MAGEDLAILEEAYVAYSELYGARGSAKGSIPFDKAGLSIFPDPQEIEEGDEGKVCYRLVAGSSGACGLVALLGDFDWDCELGDGRVVVASHSFNALLEWGDVFLRRFVEGARFISQFDGLGDGCQCCCNRAHLDLFSPAEKS